MKFFLLTVFAALTGLASAEISYAYHEGAAVSAVATDDPGNSPGMAAYLLATKIAAPGSKSLVTMLSSEITLITSTVAKDSNKGGGKTEATAEAGITATVKYCVDCPEGGARAICAGGEGVYEAYPKGGIIFSAREQKLSVDVNLDCECEVEDLECECEVNGYVEVGLNLTTTAAHTFNFIADLSETGTGSTKNPVQPVACFDLSAEASTLVDGGSYSDASAQGYVGLQSTMFIVQEVSTSNLLQRRDRNLRG